TRVGERLCIGEPAVTAALGRRAPDEIATAAIAGTKLDDAGIRIALMKGGTAAVEASSDPLVVLARAVDPFARDARRQLEDQVDAVVDRNMELIAQARFA